METIDRWNELLKRQAELAEKLEELSTQEAFLRGQLELTGSEKAATILEQTKLRTEAEELFVTLFGKPATPVEPSQPPAPVAPAPRKPDNIIVFEAGTVDPAKKAVDALGGFQF